PGIASVNTGQPICFANRGRRPRLDASNLQARITFFRPFPSDSIVPTLPVQPFDRPSTAFPGRRRPVKIAAITLALVLASSAIAAAQSAGAAPQAPPPPQP